MTPSLCEACQNMRPVRTARSRFLLCELAGSDSHYPKYPRQPVLSCPGYQPRDQAARLRPDEPCRQQP